METATLEETPIDSAVAIIDSTINDISGRDLVSSAEMVDVLLDIRLLLSK